MGESEEDAALARLLRLIDDYRARRIDAATLKARISADGGLGELARREAGTTMERGGAVIGFGANNQIGDVHIRDVAGGDIINLTINVGAQPARAAPADPAEVAQKRALIAQHQKMLNALELQAAKFGIYAPPHVTIEIDELREKIAGLRREIGEA